MELSSAFWWFILIGLGAQLVDGALGMAFGLVSSSVMLAMGIPPAQASAAIHTAEVFTTGASGVSHLVAGNVDKRLFLRLALPGAVGGAVGAYGLTQLPGEVIRPLIYLYLLVLAIIILARAAGRLMPKGEVKRVPVLGFVAGFLDASGGGGWGPVATSTLLARGGQARTTIGTVNAAEFVVTLTVSATFLLSMGLHHLQIVAGLLIGGMMAAPVAALLVKRLKERWVLVAVGVLVLGISLFQIGHALPGYLARCALTGRRTICRAAGGPTRRGAGGGAPGAAGGRGRRRPGQIRHRAARSGLVTAAVHAAPVEDAGAGRQHAAEEVHPARLRVHHHRRLGGQQQRQVGGAV